MGPLSLPIALGPYGHMLLIEYDCSMWTDDMKFGWVVGIIEGEGHLGETDCRPFITVGSTDLDTVTRLKEFTGLGRITKVKSYKTVGKSFYLWSLHRKAECEPLLRRMLPYFGERRKARATEILAKYDEKFDSAGNIRNPWRQTPIVRHKPITRPESANDWKTWHSAYDNQNTQKPM